MIEAAFFDLYETLVTEFVLDWRPKPSLAERLGVDPTAFDAAWHARREHRMTGVCPDYATALREICDALGQPIDQEVTQRLCEERLADKAAPFARIEGEVVDALGQLRRMGVKLGLVSNCAPEEVAGWEGCHLATYSRDAVLSYQVGCAKPDPRIYRLACRRLGVAPGRAIFVGDGGSDELTGAALAGLTPYWATWFLRCWPAWKRSGLERVRAAAYPQLRTPAEVVAVADAATCRRAASHTLSHLKSR